VKIPPVNTAVNGVVVAVIVVPGVALVAVAVAVVTAVLLHAAGILNPGVNPGTADLLLPPLNGNPLRPLNHLALNLKNVKLLNPLLLLRLVVKDVHLNRLRFPPRESVRNLKIGDRRRLRNLARGRRPIL